jgi:hypothetical protein
MNNSRQIVGSEGSAVNWNLTGDAGGGQATLWTQTAGTWGVSVLPGLASGSYGAGANISNSGMIVGWSNTTAGSLSESNEGYQNAVYWTNTGSGWQVTNLVNRSVYTLGAFCATAVNDSGTIVGWGAFGGINPENDNQWVEWNSSGQMTQLGTLGYSAPNDVPLGINDHGVIVGNAVNTSDTEVACIYGYGGNNGMQNMNTVFASYIPSGWSLTSATAIDNNGDIVGYGTDNGAGSLGFLLAPAMAGDANLDGKVDINDLTVVLANYGQTGATWSQGDFIGDGKVDINDLTIVLANYGQTFGASPAGNLSAVPEPGALVLLGLGAAGLLGWFWRARR